MKSLALLLLLAGACTDEPEQPTGPEVNSRVETKVIPMYFNTRIDLVVVVDNSPAMAPIRAKLEGDYRTWLAALSRAAAGTLPDIHLGVVTTDLADQGRLRTGGFLSHQTTFNWQDEQNYAGPVADRFAELANAGTAGTTDTRPLEALQRALDPSVNPGFIREDAYLAVIVLTASDDHGTQAIADVAHVLKTLKSDPSKVMLVGGFGACTQGAFTATAAPRLAQLWDLFPNRNSSATLCSDTLPDAFAITNQLLKTTLGIPCMESVVSTPYQCAAWLEDPHSEDQIILPMCSDAADDRCWSLGSEPQQCPGGDHTVLKLRPYVVPFPATANFQCVVE